MAEQADLVERLAELEHEQWVSWSKALADEVPADRRRRWEACWVAYRDLPEELKEHDRVWARRVLALLGKA
jgi:hypothetical protein